MEWLFLRDPLSFSAGGIFVLCPRSGDPPDAPMENPRVSDAPWDSRDPDLPLDPIHPELGSYLIPPGDWEWDD